MKKKNKLIKRLLLFFVVGIIIVVGYMYYYNSSNDIVDGVLSEEYNNLYNKGYGDAETEKILTLKGDYVDKISSLPYQYQIYELFTEPYFIYDNLDRYFEYRRINETSTKDTVMFVNANRDYEQYTNITDVDLSKGDLILVNKYYTLKSDYVPSNLVNINNGNGKVKEVTNNALIIMGNAAKEAGLTLFAQSTYRTYATQSYLYNNYVATEGKIEADRQSARPGHSEHQTGLTIDFIIPGDTLENFYLSDEFEWLRDNSYKYGFIMRYPEGKESVTGYMYEPWHYRYVGKEIALYIHDNGITYDEYYAYFIAK